MKMVSGIGQFHTNEPGKPSATPYLTIDWGEIRALVDNPQQVEKAQAQWLISSTLPSRSFKEQEQNGQYVALWADLDKNPPDQDRLGILIDLFIPGVDYEIYSSKSATAENMKCRILIFLSEPLTGADWTLAQSVLNDMLELCDIIPDRANERTAQLCYLPNRGAFYRSKSKRDGKFFAPLQFWATEIAAKREQITAATLAAETAKQAAAAKRASLNLSNTPDIITAFNQAFTVEEWLTTAGYDRRGDSFMHPDSESGSYSATVKDGRVNALSPNDRLYNNGAGAHDAFSVFAVLMHSGDRDAAMRDAGDNLLTINGLSYNKVKQLEWAKNHTPNPTAVFGQNGHIPTMSTGRNTIANFHTPNAHGCDVRDGTNTTRPLSELGNALRLQDAHGDNIRYVHDAGAWLHWSNGAWLWDVDGAIIRRLAATLPDGIYKEGEQYSQFCEAFAKWSRTSQKERTINAAVSLLEDFEQIRKPLSLIDADLFKVGIDNARQVLDLKIGVTRPATQADFLTKSLNVAELGDSSKAIRWQAFLTQIFGDAPELIDWLKRWCGYLLTGDTSEHFLIFCFGLGANGKSVFADTLRYILGDYARAIAPETLTESKRLAGSATPDLAELIGARLAISSETEDGAALAESLIKSLVSGDTMPVRKLYTASVQYTPQFKLMMLGNHKPIIKGNDYGIWRRVRLIPFQRTFKESDRDPKLLDKLRAEAPHILAWMVDGCVDWLKRGLSDTPETIKQATGDYQEEQDLIGRWLSENCTLSPTAESTATALYTDYKRWAESNGLRPYNKIALGRKLSELGYSNRKSNGVRYWVGIAVDLSRIFNPCVG